MKKFFTLIAMACMAVCAYAQGAYYIPSDWSAKNGDTETSVAGITMTWGDFKSLKSVSDKFDDAKFDYKVTGSSNATNATGAVCNDGKDLVPVTGGFVKFEPTVAGTLSVAYKVGSGKTQYFVEDGVLAKTVANDGEDSSYNLTDISVKANSVYYVYTQGSKMDFFGFKFETSSTGIKSISAESAADAPAYNLAGQRVAKDAKGLVIVNGKKYMNK